MFHISVFSENPGAIIVHYTLVLSDFTDSPNKILHVDSENKVVEPDQATQVRFPRISIHGGFADNFNSYEVGPQPPRFVILFMLFDYRPLSSRLLQLLMLSS